jgi:N utilization substance protein A
MTVIVGEDQLSLAIGKKGQNVRLATRLVGWDIKIVSEEVLKKEIALQMGRMIASGEAVPITELEGVTPGQAEILSEHGIEDIEKLAAASVDDLSEFLNVSLDEAESILTSARAIVAAKEGDAESAAEPETAEAPEQVEVEAVPADSETAPDDSGATETTEDSEPASAAEEVALTSEDAGASETEEEPEGPASEESVA